MGIRDREIERLIKYSQGLGINITFSDTLRHAAEWVIDGTEIIVSRNKNNIKTDMILTLIHELGHHLWFIHKKERQPDLKFEEALDRENLHHEKIKGITPKRLRKKILEIEKEGVRYWDVIVRDVNIKIPTWKIEFAKEFDMWQYEYYYETGKFDNRAGRRLKRKELIKKHKGNI